MIAGNYNRRGCREKDFDDASCMWIKCFDLVLLSFVTRMNVETLFFAGEYICGYHMFKSLSSISSEERS
ncbi:hypothetical protein QVD17_05533 [Tagetes erecta]|uniref:Uncharacterized protein n=1 Tax=Tagetes erecta TaxID=13708 RepID=A0AAD8PAM1_TARER|nr:hypothetical protein QVD17_05533 [Tagetes erecta]